MSITVAPDKASACGEFEHPLPHVRNKRRRVNHSALHSATPFGGILTALVVSPNGRVAIAVAALMITGVLIGWKLWIAKRRDDTFARVATQDRADPALLRELTIHEAVRSKLLLSEDAARLLRPGQDDHAK
jgi:hypothetical protein